ncbi:PREDICTED: anthocyanin 5-aromatic acyltransferase-like [Nelumbo nucifera]|uniref:Uncharacterized protein n=2 Tax=Nelumbo nucifera TaxID=4432 RepID=A0A822ZAZ4_NELNU|nr:PREDICTED: anthocyanin 5-aromatic acyltransferase-like [Nelumbo nucifera]DAD42292.1 TPA_asm: hypothetical protein HUJ06_000522 [Nelumbo nucifera]
MAPPKSVKVVELCKVAPAAGSGSGSVIEASLPLSFFDLFWLPVPPTQLLYFYRFPHSSIYFRQSLLPRIKHSLSLTLFHFYPFAGHLSWPPECPKPMIHYAQGDSVSLAIAESDGNFYHLSGNKAQDAKELHPLIPELRVSRSTVPMLALQITVFPDSGICLGVTMPHAVADARTIMNFINAWSSACRLGEISLSTEALPCYEKTVIKDPKGLEEMYLNQLTEHYCKSAGNPRLDVLDFGQPDNTVRATFELSRANIATLKAGAMALHKDKQLPPARLSTFTLLCAYIWVSLVKSGDQRVSLSFNVDCGARQKPPVPATYFGNCVGTRVVTAERADLLRHDGIVIAACLIEESINGLEDGALDGAEGWVSRLLSSKSEGKIWAAGSPRLGIYDADFGWGRPKKVELASIDKTGAIFIRESCNGDGGVEVSLALMKHEMDAFASVFVNGLEAKGSVFHRSGL